MAWVVYQGTLIPAKTAAAERDAWRKAFDDERAAHQATREALAVASDRAKAAVEAAGVNQTAARGRPAEGRLAVFRRNRGPKHPNGALAAAAEAVVSREQAEADLAEQKAAAESEEHHVLIPLRRMRKVNHLA